MKTCEVCGKEYEPHKRMRSRQKYCSPRCKATHDVRAGYVVQATVACKQCGEMFQQKRRNQAFCCYDCRQRWFRAEYRRQGRVYIDKPRKRNPKSKPVEAPRTLPVGLLSLGRANGGGRRDNAAAATQCIGTGD